MPVFESDAEAHERLGALLRAVAADDELGARAREADAVVQLQLREPAASVTADLRAGRGVRVDTGSSKLTPDIVLAMDGDVAHRLWAGELNPLLALAHREVSIKGPTAKFLRLVPLFGVVAPRYREWVEGGFPEVVVEEAAPAADAPAAEDAAPEAEAVPAADAPPAEALSADADAAPTPEESATEEEPPASEAPSADAAGAADADASPADADAPAEPETPAAPAEP